MEVKIPDNQKIIQMIRMSMEIMTMMEIILTISGILMMLMVGSSMPMVLCGLTRYWTQIQPTETGICITPLYPMQTG